MGWKDNHRIPCEAQEMNTFKHTSRRRPKHLQLDLQPWCISPKASQTSSSTNCVWRRRTVLGPSELLHWYPRLGLIPVSAISSSLFAYIPARTCESGAPESDLVPTGFQDTYASSNYWPNWWVPAPSRPRFPTSLPFKTFRN